MLCLYLIKSQPLRLDKWTKPYISSFKATTLTSFGKPSDVFFLISAWWINPQTLRCMLTDKQPVCSNFHKLSKESQPHYSLQERENTFPFWWAICIRHSANGLWVSVGVLSETRMVDIFRAKKIKKTAKRLHSIAYDTWFLQVSPSQI